MTPRITVLMPVYNSERFLSEAIQSILQQTFEDFELLVIDDASTDSSAEIAKSFSEIDSRVRVMKNQNSKGIVGALNFGLAEARGEWIARMDSDDRSHPARLKTQIDFLDGHPKIALVGSAFHTFRNSSFEREIYHPENSILVAWSFLFDSFVCHPSVMFKKSIILSLGMYPNRTAEDYALFSMLVQKYPCWNLQSLLLDYREHDANLSITKKLQLQESVAEISRDRFRFMFGELNHFSTLRDFTLNGVFGARDTILILRMALHFNRRICRIYRYGSLNLESIHFLFTVLRKILNGLRKKIRNRLS